MTETSTRHTTTVLGSGCLVHRWEPEGSTHRRGAVVLQHGFGEYAERYLSCHHALVPHLLDLGFEVWALDLWGHGGSPGARGVCHVGRAVYDHREVLDLAAETGLRVFAVGHSLGGLITATSAATSTVDLAAMVLLSSALPPRMSPLGRRLLGLAARLAPGAPIPQRRRPLEELSHRREIVDATAADPRMHHGQIGFLLATTALETMDQLREATPGWTPRCLLIYGTADTYTDPLGSRDLASRLGPHAIVHEVEGGYHELLGDTAGDEVLDRVVSFLTTA